MSASVYANCRHGDGLVCCVDGNALLRYCLAKPGAWQDEPWDGDIVVKVGGATGDRSRGKIFAFLGRGDALGVKCGHNRDEADELIRQYPADVSVMAYIGRSGWNTVRLAGAIPDDEIQELVDASYDLVVAKLPKRLRPTNSEPTRE